MWGASHQVHTSMGDSQLELLAHCCPPVDLKRSTRAGRAGSTSGVAAAQAPTRARATRAGRAAIQKRKTKNKTSPTWSSSRAHTPPPSLKTRHGTAPPPYETLTIRVACSKLQELGSSLELPECALPPPQAHRSSPSSTAAAEPSTPSTTVSTRAGGRRHVPRSPHWH